MDKNKKISNVVMSLEPSAIRKYFDFSEIEGKVIS